MSFRKSRLHDLIQSNGRIRALVADLVPAYEAMRSVANRAEAMLDAVERAASDELGTFPTAVDQVTDTWLDGEVDRRLAVAQREARADVLRELRDTAAAKAETLLHQNVDELVAGLSAQFDGVMQAAAANVAAMNDGSLRVATAAEAIQAGCADQWKAVADLLPAYSSIRAAQRLLYGAMNLPFDHIQCGDTQLVTDPEARLYFHSRLDEIAPGWRGGESVPWPDDPTERLVWCVNNNSGAWIPTPADINEMLTSASDRDTPSMINESVTKTRPSVPRTYGPRGQRRVVDQSNHGFDVSMRGFGKPLSQLTVTSVQSSFRDDDD